MLRAIGMITIVLALVFAGLYFAGWINFHQQPNTTTIEIETGQMNKSAHDAVEKGKDLIDEARHSAAGPEDKFSP